MQAEVSEVMKSWVRPHTTGRACCDGVGLDFCPGEQIVRTQNHSMLTELPEVLQDALEAFLVSRPDWNCDRMCAAAFSLFLLQNGYTDQRINRLYLDNTIRYSRQAS
ncbi:MAG: DUF2811 domain-containing protein [Cyanobacteria bacterium P01_F01_bin.33]